MKTPPKNASRSSRTSRASRASRRGAVMVEAALVLPLLVVFFGLFTFFHRAYKEKIKNRSEAREAAFSAASRGCPSGSSNGGSETSMAAGGKTAGEVGKVAEKKGDGTASAMNFSHGTATASKASTVSWNTAYGPWTKTLKKSESMVYCNENPIVTSAASWLEWGKKSK